VKSQYHGPEYSKGNPHWHMELFVNALRWDTEAWSRSYREGAMDDPRFYEGDSGDETKLVEKAQDPPPKKPRDGSDALVHLNNVPADEYPEPQAH